LLAQSSHISQLKSIPRVGSNPIFTLDLTNCSFGREEHFLAGKDGEFDIIIVIRAATGQKY
jgi:hypothetical protein